MPGRFALLLPGSSLRGLSEHVNLCDSLVSLVTHVITAQANSPKSVTAADLGGDGDLDVLTESNYDDMSDWYENLNGAGDFSGAQRVITTLVNGARSVAAAALDNDGDFDVLSASGSHDRLVPELGLRPQFFRVAARHHDTD